MKHIKNIRSFLNENEKNTFEITAAKDMDKKTATDIIRKHYAHNLTYRGYEFFDKIYMDILTEFSSNVLNIGETIDIDAEYRDEETGKYYTEKERKKITGQESYLGYLPKEDVFIEGYDMFDADSNLVFIKLDEKLNPKDVSNQKPFSSIHSYGDMYGRNGGYNKLHKMFNDLIDIRLD